MTHCLDSIADNPNVVEMVEETADVAAVGTVVDVAAVDNVMVIIGEAYVPQL